MDNRQRLKALKNDLNLIYGNYADINQMKLLLSALTDYNPLNSTDELRFGFKNLTAHNFSKLKEYLFLN